MKFKITKTLRSGKYNVFVELSEFSDEDERKANMHGFPKINVWNVDVSPPQKERITINRLNAFGGVEFTERESAESFVNNLKSQISKIKESWEKLKDDDWTSEEIL